VSGRDRLKVLLDADPATIDTQRPQDVRQEALDRIERLWGAENTETVEPDVIRGSFRNLQALGLDRDEHQLALPWQNCEGEAADRPVTGEQEDIIGQAADQRIEPMSRHDFTVAGIANGVECHGLPPTF